MKITKVLAITAITLSTVAITAAIVAGNTNPLGYVINIASIAISTITLYDENRIEKDFK